MSQKDVTIHFSHPAYQLSSLFELRNTGMKHFQTWTKSDLHTHIGETNILVLSGYWNNELLTHAHKLRFIQVCAAGYDSFDIEAIRSKGVRLANASGVNVNAVSDHAMALLLSLTRQLHTCRDNQRKVEWRGMISNLQHREDELAGKTMLIFGLGKIGARLARLAKAFDMTVIGLKRNTSNTVDHVDELYVSSSLQSLLPRADFIVLTCPLTETTRNVINKTALSVMKPSSYLINVARGGCVDESALVEALQGKLIAGAGIDVTVQEPLKPTSPLWTLENVVLTPHTGGETRNYEDNVIDILITNLERLKNGEKSLRNQVI